MGSSQGDKTKGPVPFRERDLWSHVQFIELLVVGEGGLEPPRPEGHWHLKPARLPFRHSPGENNRWTISL